MLSNQNESAIFISMFAVKTYVCWWTPCWIMCWWWGNAALLGIRAWRSLCFSKTYSLQEVPPVTAVKLTRGSALAAGNSNTNWMHCHNKIINNTRTGANNIASQDKLHTIEQYNLICCIVNSLHDRLNQSRMGKTKNFPKIACFLASCLQ